MDLAAFLAPGVHPVYKVGNSFDHDPWGHLLCRADGRVSWICKGPTPAGHRLVLTLKVPGYRLDLDGSLSQALESNLEAEAWVVLSGEVRSCRWFQGEYYSLRFARLVRVMD
ncbi:MAG: hypothetical protein LBE80_02005 [Deltaproteobacteria bacterium]|jgi:hypothetical protein|nr:hypothetical protein [Deltaproteobacteria bacterium]